MQYKEFSAIILNGGTYIIGKFETNKTQKGYNMKKRIMIYGDSNTHGYNAENGSRFDVDTRWTGVCQKILGDDYLIVEEGLNGRNTCHDDPEAPFLNGLSYIVPCVLSQMPLDMICVKLGSNDFGPPLNPTGEQVAKDAAKVLRAAKVAVSERYPDSACKYALFAPLKATEDALYGDFADSYDEATIKITEEAPEAFKAQAEKDGFLFFDANEHAVCGRIDGVHLDAENHRKLGEAMAAWIKEVMEGGN